jgi:ABC-type antimicrobial peptide transport system permease subunit
LIGILNLMLMAVSERTREIGILASMGLKRWETMVLFLLEGVLIGLAGAFIGCLLGGAISIHFLQELQALAAQAQALPDVRGAAPVL